MKTCTRAGARRIIMPSIYKSSINVPVSLILAVLLQFQIISPCLSYDWIANFRKLISDDVAYAYINCNSYLSFLFDPHDGLSFT